MIKIAELSTIILIIGVILVIIIGVLALVIYLHRKKTTPEISDDTFVLNFMTQFSKGYRFGYEQDVKKSKSGRWICTFYPIDIKKVKENGEIKYLIDKPQTIVVGKENRLTFARGDMSNNREEVWYIADDPSDLSVKFRNTSFGQLMMKGITYNRLLDRTFESQKGMNKAQLNIIKQLKGGELSKEMINSLGEQLVEFLKAYPKIEKPTTTTKEKEKEKEKEK